MRPGVERVGWCPFQSGGLLRLGGRMFLQTDPPSCKLEAMAQSAWQGLLIHAGSFRPER